MDSRTISLLFYHSYFIPATVVSIAGKHYLKILNRKLIVEAGNNNESFCGLRIARPYPQILLNAKL